MPVVGIDCRFGSALAGLGTFTRYLVTELTARRDSWSYVLFVKSVHEEWLAPLSQRGITIREAPFSHYSVQEQTDFPNLLQSVQCDLFHCPQFNVPFFCPIPFTCTIHDLILHHFPNEASLLRRGAYRFLMRFAVRKSQHVFCVSEATKADLRTLYGDSVAEKTSVTYPGVSAIFSPQKEVETDRVRSMYGLEKPFLLYVGNCKEHKNVRGLLAAFSEAQLPGIELVLVAGGIECAAYGRRKNVRFLSTIPTSDLPALYSASLGCVSATLMEGFCLPLIEAMACGTPVLATNVGPIPEVCAEHALLVKPSSSEIAEGIRRLVLDSAFRDAERLARARTWTERYSWNRTASATASVFGSILAQK